MASPTTTSRVTQGGTVFRSNTFTGKTCLVTGGGTGIGRSVAIELLVAGAQHVIIAARNIDRLRASAAEIADVAARCSDQQPLQRRFGTVIPYKLNIRDDQSVAQCLTELTERYGRIDCLVNNGGGQFASPAHLISAKGWRAVIDTNLNGTWLMCQGLYLITPKDRRRGIAIVNVIADYFNGFPGMAHTGAARAGVDNITRTLAREWGSEGIRINSVAPGIILSSGVDNYPDSVRASFFGPSAYKVPLRRSGSEGEVSSAVVYLLSPAAAYITGATLRVDGGSSLSKSEGIVDTMVNIMDATEAPLLAAREVPAAVPPRVTLGLDGGSYHIAPELRAEFERRVHTLMLPPSPSSGGVGKTREEDTSADVMTTKSQSKL